MIPTPCAKCRCCYLDVHSAFHCLITRVKWHTKLTGKQNEGTIVGQWNWKTRISLNVQLGN